jgi:hypothetical protein
MPTDFCGVPIGPGTLAQRTTGMAMPGFCHSPLPAPWPTRGFRGGQAQRVHELSGIVEACEVPQFGHRGDRYGARHAAQGLERFDHGM